MRPHLHRSAVARKSALAVAAIVAFTSAYALPEAQAPAKKALSVDDYPKWRSISGQEISSDGAWVVYTQQFSNTAPADAKPVLHC